MSFLKHDFYPYGVKKQNLLRVKDWFRKNMAGIFFQTLVCLLDKIL